MKFQSGSLIRIILALCCLLIGGWGVGAQEGTAPPPPPDKTTTTPPPGGTETPPPSGSGTQSSWTAGAGAGGQKSSRASRSTPARNRPSGGSQQTALGASGTSSDAKNWVAGNVGILGAGAQYERVILPRLSVGAGIYYYSLIIFNTFGVEANVRYYPFSGVVRGLYGEMGIGFGMDTGAIITTDGGGGGFGGFLLRPGVGWKFDVGKPGGFFVEPNLSIPMIIGKGFGINFVARAALGYAW